MKKLLSCEKNNFRFAFDNLNIEKSITQQLRSELELIKGNQECDAKRIDSLRSANLDNAEEFNK